MIVTQNSSAHFSSSNVLPQVRRPDLTVIMAALNEEGNIGNLVTAILERFAGLGIQGSVLVVDGGSSDKTREEATAAGARCLIQKRIGYGGALREGFLAANSDFVITLDADGSHNPALLDTLWQNRHQGEVVIASRFIRGGYSEAPWARRVLSIILNGVFRTVLDLKVADTSSGYRLYKKEVLTPNSYRFENFSILQEILVRAISEGYSVHEVPLHMLPRGAGSSHVAFLKFCISYLSTLYQMWLLRNRPSAADYEARAWNSRNLIQRFWQRKRTSILDELSLGSGILLDVGCGSANFQRTHPNHIGMDISLAKLRYLRTSEGNRVNGEAHTLPFQEQSVGRVVLSQVLHLSEDPEVVLKEASRVLTEDGTLVVGIPDEGRPQWKVIKFLYRLILPNVRQEPQASKLSRHTLVEMLAKSGFRVEKTRYILQSELIVQARKISPDLCITG